jgi:two-component system copper resistance phosphate regulon response regulator CusR
MKVLVVEDDRKTAQLLKVGLVDEGFTVDLCFNGEDAAEMVDQELFDLVILDVMLPGWDGWQVLQHIRDRRIDALVIMLTARDAVEHRVRGLNSGADDYLVKPFAFAELVARVRALLRRKGPPRDEVFQYQDLSVDVRRHVVRRGGARIELSPTELKLLSLLLEHQGEVLTRSFIVDRVWDMSFDSDSNVVDVNVRRIRAKIDAPFEQKILHTIRGRGYVIR